MRRRTPVTPFTPAELADVRERTVEGRLYTIKGTLSLLEMLTTAISQSEDLCLSRDVTQTAWLTVSTLCGEAIAAVVATQEALPSEALFLKAPRDGEE
jgi:hypothetical protein